MDECRSISVFASKSDLIKSPTLIPPQGGKTSPLEGRYRGVIDYFLAQKPTTQIEKPILLMLVTHYLLHLVVNQ